MNRRILSYVAVITATVVLTTLLQPLSYFKVSAQGGCQTFKPTGKTVCGRFLQYWQENGGLRQQGYPISNQFVEVSDLNGQSYTVQYFERAVFEMHPENEAPNDVLLSQLGTFRFRDKYPNGEPGPIKTGTPVPPSGQITNTGEKVQISPKVYLTIKNVTLNSTQTAWEGTISNESGKAFFILLDKNSLSVRDSNGKTYTNAKDTYCYPFNVPPDVQPDQSVDVKLCTPYTPTSGTVNFLDLIIANISGKGPFIIRYTP